MTHLLFINLFVVLFAFFSVEINCHDNNLLTHVIFCLFFINSPFFLYFVSFFLFDYYNMCFIVCLLIHSPNHHYIITPSKKTHAKHMLIVISDTSFESGLSEDYAIPPDALSQADSTYMDASIPSILMRSSYVDSPNKKMESLEKVRALISSLQ